MLLTVSEQELLSTLAVTVRDARQKFNFCMDELRGYHRPGWNKIAVIYWIQGERLGMISKNLTKVTSDWTISVVHETVMNAKFMKE